MFVWLNEDVFHTSEDFLKLTNINLEETLQSSWTELLNIFLLNWYLKILTTKLTIFSFFDFFICFRFYNNFWSK